MSMSMLHVYVHTPCRCSEWQNMSALHVQVHALSSSSCCLSMSMLHVYAAKKHAGLACYLNMLLGHVA
jgi:hypothetical protein